MDPQLAQLMRQFGQGNGGGMGGPAPLVEIKAGKMNFDGKMVTADRRKGVIQVTEDPLQPGMKTF